MKKIMLILIAVLCLFLLIGCSAEQPVDDDKKITSTGPSSVKEESQKIEEVPIRASMSTELKELIAKANTVESVRYFYQSTEGGNMDVDVKGSKMKQIFDPILIDNKHYDTFYKKQ